MSAEGFWLGSQVTFKIVTVVMGIFRAFPFRKGIWLELDQESGDDISIPPKYLRALQSNVSAFGYATAVRNPEPYEVRRVC
jgi:hypothetical protein